MPGYDAGRSNYTPATAGPTDPVAEVWSVSMDTSSSGPVLVDETLFGGSDDGSVWALDARTGTERWRQSVGAPAGPPRAMDGHLYVPTTRGIVALDGADGTEEWRVETPDRDGVLVASHGVYYVSSVHPPSVVALDRADGSERWRVNITEPWTSAMFATDEYIFVSTGTKWDEPWLFAADSGTYRGGSRPEEGGADLSDEQFVLDGTVFAADSMMGELSAYPVSDGTYGPPDWTTTIDAYNGFALSGGATNLYFQAESGEQSGLYAVSLTDGSQTWVESGVDAIIGRPVVAKDVVVVLTDEALRCVGSDTGSELWAYPGDEVGPQFVIADDLVFTVSDTTVRALRSVSSTGRSA